MNADSGLGNNAAVYADTFRSVVFSMGVVAGEKLMRIEQIGFYETRDGRLRYVVGRFPDGTKSQYQWVVSSNYGVYSPHLSSGHFYPDKTEDEDDLVRYLPTVKSWTDPIPPPEPPLEPPAVTVYTEWLSVGEDGNRWTGWTKGDVKPCYAVVRLRTVEVPANG
jgi:hypothetical protein